MEPHVHFDLHDELVNQPEDQECWNSDFDNIASISDRIPDASGIAACGQAGHRVFDEALRH